MLQYYDITLSIRYGNGTRQYKPLIPCTIDQWAALGDNTQKYFDQSLLSYFLCPSTSDNLDLKKTWLVTDPQSIRISIKPCDENVAPCLPYTDQNNRMETIMS